MDPIKEQVIINKKWFLHWNGNHHGPFSALEVYAWTQKKRSLQDIYIWSGGMENWVLFDDSELQKDFKKFPAFYNQLCNENDLPILWRDWDQVKSEINNFSNPAIPRDSSVLGIPWNQPTQDFSGLSHEEKGREIPSKSLVGFNLTRDKFKKGKFLWVLAALSLGLMVGALYLNYSWNLISKPNGVTELEYKELLRAREEISEINKEQVAIALDMNTLESPQFYLTSNLPEKEELLLEIRGVNESLIGAFQYAQRIILKNKNGLLVPPQLYYSKAEKIMAIPKGYYQVMVSYKKQVLLQKSYFLGGVHDANYQLELAQYHIHLKKKFEDELNEINQILKTLDGQVDAMNDSFERLLLQSQKLSTENSVEWQSERRQWINYQKQIASVLENYRFNSKSKIYFLNATYSSIIDIGDQAIESYKKIEQLMISKRIESDDEIGVSLDLAKLKNHIGKLKERLLHLEAKYKKSNELPWTEVI